MEPNVNAEPLGSGPLTSSTKNARSDAAPLTVYRLRPLDCLEDAVDLEKAQRCYHDRLDNSELVAELYVPPAIPRPPGWAGFIASGFPSAPIGLTASPSALLIVSVPETGTAESDQRRFFYAFTFGVGGRHLLRMEAVTSGFGLHAALNLLYPRHAAESPLERIRAVETSRRQATVRRSAVQVADAETFENLDVDRLVDLVRKATGAPAETDQWGSRISGSDSLAINARCELVGLPALCRELERVYESLDYQDHFAWIDSVRAVTDPSLAADLAEAVVNLLRDQATENISLSPPEIVDWERVCHFKLPRSGGRGRGGSAVLHVDLRLADYLRGLKSSKLLGELSIERLKSDRVIAIDANHQIIHSWAVWRCLHGEIRLGDDTYVLDGGTFFKVDDDYISELNSMIDGIPVADVGLPASTVVEHEGDYNVRAASTSDSLVLLDKASVVLRGEGRTTPIEICDLLSKDRQLIHVKRHLGSSDLSHLFAQGRVSAELLHSNTEFRKMAHERIVFASSGHPDFDFIDDGAFDPRKFEIVYAIVERWKGRRLSDAMPFFSRVNLRHTTDLLRARGYRVSVRPIEAVFEISKST